MKMKNDYGSRSLPVQKPCTNREPTTTSYSFYLLFVARTKYWLVVFGKRLFVWIIKPPSSMSLTNSPDLYISIFGMAPNLQKRDNSPFKNSFSPIQGVTDKNTPPGLSNSSNR